MHIHEHNSGNMSKQQNTNMLTLLFLQNKVGKNQKPKSISNR